MHHKKKETSNRNMKNNEDHELQDFRNSVIKLFY